MADASRGRIIILGIVGITYCTEAVIFFLQMYEYVGGTPRGRFYFLQMYEYVGYTPGGRIYCLHSSDA